MKLLLPSSTNIRMCGMGSSLQKSMGLIQEYGRNTGFTGCFSRQLLAHQPCVEKRFATWGSWYARRRVRRDREHIVFAQMRNDRLHQLRPNSRSKALLHVIELAHYVARRAARNPWHRSQPLQVRAMAAP